MCKNNGKNVWKVALAAILAAAVSVGLASCSGQKDDDLQAVNDLTSVSQLLVGQHVTFGVYEQDNDASNGADPVEWRVLAVEDGRALLITEKLMDYVAFRYDDSGIKDASFKDRWNISTLRRWLESFDYFAFHGKDNDKLTYSDNYRYSYSFVLNKDEVNQYFTSEVDRIASPTAYANTQAYNIQNVNDIQSMQSYAGVNQSNGWWLYPSGADKNSTFVNPIGKVTTDRKKLDDKLICMRPAVWITL